MRQLLEDPAGQLEGEGLTEHGELAEEEAVVARETVDPGGHHVVHRVGQLVHVTAVRGGGDQLTEEQWIPTGPVHDRAELPWGECRVRGGDPCELECVLLRQRPQVDP